MDIGRVSDNVGYCRVYGFRTTMINGHMPGAVIEWDTVESCDLCDSNRGIQAGAVIMWGIAEFKILVQS